MVLILGLRLNIDFIYEKKKSVQETSCSSTGGELGLPTSADGFPFVEEVKDVPTPLMVQSENWPKGLDLPFSLVRFCFSWDTEEKDV